MDINLDGKKLLIVDDDQVWLNQLSRAMTRRGLLVFEAQSVEEALNILVKEKFDYGVIDLRLDDGDGLEIISELRKLNPKSKSIILTGFGNIANAVSAIKLGAVDYLAKPANIEDIISSLFVEKDEKVPPPEQPMSANRIRWEHIQRVYELCDKNVSETARRLKMHRRTLQRILSKRAPK
ncbi:MAG: ActR/PrrA/RegA family redox response regulator transcription factor [Pseudomonadota bacterium]|nr:ActR/PrrA/RegA family redox response regulator transcription factor [Pseudomonadota bacterium]MEC7735229.1 ActR/PrrA/RegA family redox response regulator transcription factor [Pseudomonadota bacterium]MEC9392209.1 ActR/PrrA/RegA family redox response regulator transcription factor [Pseudomonadota bacterium]MEC9458853.1 ActR/PrrA/RegA family redox response regulator transcription factor [Pseudomonadota bacterium]MED5437154.1 ActR/PrrA/RegA family redox response regulator transcription factor 